MYKNVKSLEESLCFPVRDQAEQEEHVGRKLTQVTHILRNGTFW